MKALISPVDAQLESSFRHCAHLARRTGRNFYFSFLTLPKEKRNAMCVIYSWMRRIDDLADESPTPEAARTAVQTWMRATHIAIGPWGTEPPPETPSSLADSEDLLWPAFRYIVQQYRIPVRYFDEIAEGALMDQEFFRYQTFEDLYRYCYRVASVVGLVCLKVFQYEDPKVEKYGEYLGIAFQLTNIIRDVREDAARNRIYIPEEDLRQFGVSEDDILNSRWSDPMLNLLKAFTERAEEYYQKATPCIEGVSPEARPTLRIMIEIYGEILKRIRDADYGVFDRRISVPTWKKFWIVLKHRFS